MWSVFQCDHLLIWVEKTYSVNTSSLKRVATRQESGRKKKNAASKYYLQFFSKAREHVGDTLIDGSCPLKQQEAFRGRGKVQQVVQQRLLPHHAIITTHSASWATRLDSLHVSVDRFFHALIEKTHLWMFMANTG